MTIFAFLGVLVLGIILAYLPLSERASRSTAIAVAIATIGALGWTVISGAAPEGGSFGFGHALMWSGTSIAGLALVLLPYLLLTVVSHQAFAFEHLQSSLSLSSLRHRIALLHVTALGAVLTVLANSVWIFALGFAIMLAAFFGATGVTKQKVVAGTIALLALFVALAFLGGSFTYADLSQLRFDALLEGARPNAFFVSGFVALLIILGALAGLVPLGRQAEKFLMSESAVMNGVAQSIVSIAAFFGILRLGGVADVTLGRAAIEPFYLTLGMVTVGVAAALLVRHQSNALLIDRLFMLFAGLTVFVAGIGPAGIIASLMFLTARGILAPLAALALAGGKTNTRRWIDIVVLSAIGTPISGAFVGYLITIGYGVQLRLVATLFVGVLVALASTSVVMHRAHESASQDARTWTDKIAVGLVVCQALVFLFLLTPTAIQYSVGALEQLTSSL